MRAHAISGGCSADRSRLDHSRCSDLAPCGMDSTRQAAQALRDARHVLAITGAGLSADSGLPTYRGVAGLYAGGLTDEGIPYEIALSGEMLRRDPAVTWKHMGRIEEACRGGAPNRGHEVIAALEGDGRRVTVLTQNVDGFHVAAGSTDVIEIHGTTRRMICVCGWSQEPVAWDGMAIPPICPACGAAARPDVVLFGEMLPDRAVRRMMDAEAAAPDVVLSVGTSSLFPYIAAPMWRARARGATTIEINPQATDVSAVTDIVFRAGAAETLDAIWRALQEES